MLQDDKHCELLEMLPASSGTKDCRLRQTDDGTIVLKLGALGVSTHLLLPLDSDAAPAIQDYCGAVMRQWTRK